MWGRSGWMVVHWMLKVLLATAVGMQVGMLVAQAAEVTPVPVTMAWAAGCGLVMWRLGAGFGMVEEVRAQRRAAAETGEPVEHGMVAPEFGFWRRRTLAACACVGTLPQFVDGLMPVVWVGVWVATVAAARKSFLARATPVEGG